MSSDKRHEMETIGQSRCVAAKSAEECGLSLSNADTYIHTYIHPCYVNMYENPSVVRKVGTAALIGLLIVYVLHCSFEDFLSLYNTNFMFSAFALLVSCVS